MLGQRCRFWVRLCSIKTQILQKYFRQCSSLLKRYLWWKFRQDWTIFPGVRGQKPHAVMYLHDMYLQTKNLLKPDIQFFDLISRNSKTTLKNRHICHELPCILSLSKFLYKLDCICGSIPWKTTYNSPK